MALLTTEQRVSVSVAPKTDALRPARIDGVVVWASDDATVATVISSGPTSAIVTAVPRDPSDLSVAPRSAGITAVFDADLDQGEVREMVFAGSVSVVEPEATSGELVFEAPELTPPAA